MTARPQRSALAAIHIARKRLAMEDDDYRAMLRREAGVDSARDLDAVGVRRVMQWFETHGFRRGFRREARGTASDPRPIVRKARALWISLYQLDEVSNRSDKALDGFAKRVTGKETLRFCTNGEAGKVVEALKAWCGRAGMIGGGMIGAGISGAGMFGDGVAAVVAEQRRRLEAHRDGGSSFEPDGLADTMAMLANCVGGDEVHQRDAADRAGDLLRRLKLGRRHAADDETTSESRRP